MIKKISQMDSKLGMREGNFPVENGATGLFCFLLVWGNRSIDAIPYILESVNPIEIIFSPICIPVQREIPLNPSSNRESPVENGNGIPVDILILNHAQAV
jgi:hypothetical protein